jgi:hypothetical protein
VSGNHLVADHDHMLVENQDLDDMQVENMDSTLSKSFLGIDMYVSTISLLSRERFQRVLGTAFRNKNYLLGMWYVLSSAFQRGQAIEALFQKTYE